MTDDDEKVGDVDRTPEFEAQRARLLTLASKVLGDATEAEDVVQTAWLRMHRTDAEIDHLPAWLTTVTTRLCLDRLRARTPVPRDEIEVEGCWGSTATDPADEVALADTVGLALQVVLDRLTPRERVAFVLHDSFGFEFPRIATVLDTSPAAARKLASRARAKVARPTTRDPLEDWLEDWEVVDAFMSAARNGDLTRLLHLLAPDVVVVGDDAAIRVGTPTRIAGRREVAAFFDGAARSALPVFVGTRPGAAWFDQGTARVAFDFTVSEGVVRRIDLRADPQLLTAIDRRRDDTRREDLRKETR